ncbi:MAG: 50S ribosomal protein L21 [Candidatus Adiutrix sp.]|jgi:large subunit ribosomal protein L21|nr:50S ribosomal protein L21 [Candidatus Adiutrix sp.]
MYAVIKTGGRQYRVEPGQIVRVNKLEANVGDVVSLNEVLLVKDGDALKAGTPVLAGAQVSATVVAQDRAKKIIVFKKKRRQGYQKKQGHRQYFTALKIIAINL